MSGMRYPCCQSRLSGDDDDHHALEIPDRSLKTTLDDRSWWDFWHITQEGQGI